MSKLLKRITTLEQTRNERAIDVLVLMQKEHALGDLMRADDWQAAQAGHWERVNRAALEAKRDLQQYSPETTDEAILLRHKRLQAFIQVYPTGESVEGTRAG